MQHNSLSAKRTLTEQQRESLVASNHSPSSSSPDMSARLRSVAARVRKNVTEGYTIPPPFSKSYSTGDIFNSANDTLRNIFPPASSKTAEIVLVSPKKRARPYPDQDYDGDYAIEGDDDDTEMALDGQRVGTSLPPDTPTLGRPMKLLPSRRTPRKGMLTTRSLPASSMRQLECKAISDVTIEEEEDWSVLAAQTPTTSFEPMMLS